MTGQVKEEILTRLGELGVTITQGQLHFNPILLRPDEFLSEPDDFTYIDIQGNQQTLSLPANSLAFTLCQTPIIYTRNEEATIEVAYTDGRLDQIQGIQLDVSISRHLFDRDGQIKKIQVMVEV